jgi:antitoxin component YwqK of YwqJK toxin-antitoxin module
MVQRSLLDIKNMEIEIKKEYHDNGKLWTEHSFLNNLLHGVQKMYYDNGQIRFYYFSRNNFDHGMDLRWYQNGEKYLMVQCKNGQRNGPKIIFKYGNY